MLARLLLGMLAMVAIALGGALVRSARSPRPPSLRAVEATPEAGHLALRVGKPVHFSAAARGALGFSWFLSGRPVSHDAAWAFVPGSEDAGLQQVKVVIAGQDGARVRREWDVLIETAVAPEVVERVPSGAVVSASDGDAVSFRCAARLPKGDPSDLVQFAWTIDGHAVQRDERAGTGGISELVVPAPGPGIYHVVARISEVDEAVSLAEWTLVVRASEPVLQVAARHAPARETAAARDDRRVARGPEPARGPQGVDLSRGPHPLVAPSGAALVRVATPEPTAAPPPVAKDVAEEEIRRWLEEYAQAWSRKDLEALRRMGHVQTVAQAERLRRYFRSVDDLRVDLHVVAVHVDGDRISVDLERTETVTDPSGDRQTLRSPLVRKEIERGPHGLRFAEPAKRS
jgi:hypothetical protein